MPDLAPSLASEHELPIQSFDGAWLSGTLSLCEPLRALAVTVHGSLLQTRDGDLDGERAWMFPHSVPPRGLFRDFRDSVLGLGVGTYRYDKRASGKSEGIFAQTSLTALARDLMATVEELRRRHPSIPVGVAAQSEGGYTCMRAIELGFTPDFVILQGSPLEPLDDMVEFQRTRAAKPFLDDPTGELATKYPFISALYDATYRRGLLDDVRGGREDYELRAGDWRCRIGLELYREYDMDTLDLLERTPCPVLVVNGELDGNVSANAAARLESATGPGLDHVEIEILDGLDHSFREVRAGEGFIETMSRPISPRYRRAIERFLAAALPRPAQSARLGTG